MSEMRERECLDATVSDAAREGLTGTTPATLYKPLPVRDQITIPPDGRPPEVQPAWRRDFPIDWPQDQYVARRDFSKFMVLTSLAFFVGQVWIGVLVITAFVFSDTVDGIMARQSGGSTKWGAYLDSTLDRIGDAAIFGGLKRLQKKIAIVR